MYTLHLTSGKNVTLVEEVETPHRLSDLVPGALYNVRFVLFCKFLYAMKT